MTESLLTWEDVNWLRREAGRHERYASRRGRGAGEIASGLKRAARLRELADRIEKQLQERAA